MATINPFKALRPNPQYAAALASRPYDVLNRAEAYAEAEGNPVSFLHITKAEIDLPDSIDLHSPEVYEKAKQNLERFIADNILFTETRDCYYIYKLVMDGRSQTGLVCVSSVEDYFNDVIKKHEYTRPEKEKDRIDHMKTILAQTGNVFMAYNNVPELDQLIEQWKQDHSPLYDFKANDGIGHSIWSVNESSVVEKITTLFREKVPATYIADGHHRAASAAKVSKTLPGSEAGRYFLTTIFPASELAILDYNRVVKELNGYDPSQLVAALEKNFEVAVSATPVRPAQLHEFGMYLDKQWYILKARNNTYNTDPVGILDISIFSSNVLDKLLGIKDQRTDTRIDFVGGIRGLDELERRVNSGEMKVAFSFFPVTIRQLFDIADSGNVMPPKSTWFEPKLRDGLLTHRIG